VYISVEGVADAVADTAAVVVILVVEPKCRDVVRRMAPVLCLSPVEGDSAVVVLLDDIGR
jgi:hypothetical protein